VDVGGTKVAAALVDRRGRLFAATRLPTEVSNPQATLDGIAKAVDGCLEASGVPRSQVIGAGFGIPGLVDPERGIGLYSVNLGWRDIPVRDELERRTGLACAIENDARAAALGEARFGAGREVDYQLFLIIGTGIAATATVQKQIYRGAHNLAGEIGHAVIEPGGWPCKCGAQGCFEALAAGPAIAARYLRKLQPALGNGLPLASTFDEKSLTAEKVFQLALEGDSRALETVQETAEYVAHALQFLALAYDPQVIVIGGGVSRAGDPFLLPVRQALQRRAEKNLVLGKMYSPGLVQLSRLGNEIGVLGAASLVAPDEWAFEQIGLSGEED
jgi:glucokinase